MGSDDSHPEERPARIATVGPFWIDRHEVTNAEFATFVAATGYVTVTERAVDATAYVGVDPIFLESGAIVFVAPESVSDMIDIGQWWRYVPGADWRHPEGPPSSIEGRLLHPVVHVTRDDALAYAHWLGRDLPTEAEWEFAARGGLEAADYIWGDEKVPEGEWQANAWQGVFPVINQVIDGYEGTAPTGCFAANGYGLHDMAGNVWELTKDDYVDIRGPQPGMGVIKGGSLSLFGRFLLPVQAGRTSTRGTRCRYVAYRLSDCSANRRRRRRPMRRVRDANAYCLFDSTMTARQGCAIPSCNNVRSGTG